MKKLILLLTILVSFKSWGQNLFPNTQTRGNSLSHTTLFRDYGAYNPTVGLILPVYFDTISLNNNAYIKWYDGAMAKTVSPIAIWYRDLTNRVWVQFTPGNSAGGTIDWRIGANFNWFGAATGNEALGWAAGVNKGINLTTNGITNVALNSGGLVLKGVVADTTANKVMTFNPTSKEWGYSYWYGGSGGGGSGTVTGTDSSHFLSASGTKLNARWWYNVKDYGAIPNDGTSDDVAIQAAIQACHSAGGGTVYFPIGVYDLTVAPVRLIDPGGGVGDLLCNSQLYIPWVPYDADSSEYRTIRLLGESPASTEFQVVATYPNPMNGAVLNSTYVTATDDPAGFSKNVLGALSKGAASFTNWNYTSVQVQDLSVIVATLDGSGAEVRNKMCGISFEYVAKAKLNGDVKIRTSSAPEDQLDPYPIATGYISPSTNNHADSDNGNVFISGFATGARAGEHSSYNTLVLNANIVGLEVIPYYKVIVNSLIAENNAYTIKMQDESNLAIVGWSGEKNTTPGKFYSPVADITEGTSGARGTITAQHITINNTGAPATPTKIGDSIVVKIGSDQYGTEYSPLNWRLPNVLNYNDWYYDSTTNTLKRYDGNSWESFGTGTLSNSISSLTAATGTNTIGNTSFKQEWQWNDITSNEGLKLSINSATGHTFPLFRVSNAGANGSSNLLSYAGFFENTRTGTTSTNIGGWFKASGGTTNNAIYSDAGNVMLNQSSGGIGGFTQLGENSNNTGVLKFAGITSGKVSIQPADAAGTWTMTLPTNDGDADQVLKTNGSGVTSWATPSGGGATVALDNLASVAINQPLTLGTSDAHALGSATKQWSDLFLAEGGVINWDNGDATLTQVGNDLTLNGAALTVNGNIGTSGGNVLIGQPFPTGSSIRFYHTDLANTSDWLIVNKQNGQGISLYSNDVSQYKWTFAPEGDFWLGGANAYPSLGGTLRGTAAGLVGIRTDPTASLHLPAGTASANTAPLKFTSGTLNTTPEIGTREYNNNHYFTNNALNRMGDGGVIYDAYADVSNTGTGETDLDTYTTKANTLGANGDKLSFTYTVNLTDVTATAQVQTYFAGTVIANTGSLTLSATGSLIVSGWVVRTGAATARASVSISSPTASTAIYTLETDLTGEDWTTTNILKLTGTAAGAGGGTGDIVFKMGSVEFKPSANN